nr:uncharacterized mitochondrial protein AtMg00810-like [Tanacetum cinerariifolium]
MPPKHDLSFSGLEEFMKEPIVSEPTVKKLVVEPSEAKASADKPKVYNTARQVSTAHPKSKVNVTRPMSHLSKIAHPTVKWTVDKKTTITNSIVTQKVNTVRSKTVNTARPKEVVNAILRNRVNAVKASAYYKEIDRGYVAFGGNPKGGKITGRGSGPNWLFDIDALTKSMNYKPVVAGNHSNGSECIKACDDAGKARMEIVHGKDYILLPLWNAGLPISQELNSSQDDRFQPSSDDEKKMDVKSAFLYEKIEEEVYVYQPPGFKDLDFPDKVYKVEKALYELHQDPRTWYKTLSIYLLDNRFHKGKIDKTLFIRRHKDDILPVQVYVDDIIFGSTKKELCKEFEKMMHEKFQMSSMGELTFFLGLQVKQKQDGIFISQDKYVAKISKKYRFPEVKNASTPMETQKPLLKDKDGEEVDVHMYRLMIGSLMYLTSSRPDIMFVVCACASYQVNLKVSHLYAVKKIFRYLKGHPKLGLLYPKDSPFDLIAYADSDYVRASLDRKSTTGGFQYMGCRLISW